MAESPEQELARSLLVALRADFPERESTARQLAELLLDAVAGALPLTRHEPAEAPLRELEALAQQTDLFAWEGAPGWDVVLQRGLLEHAPLEPGPSVLDGLGARPERTQQRGELKRRASAQAARDSALQGGLDADAEALLASVGSWQPIRWQSLRGGAPSRWIEQLCPAAPGQEMPLRRLVRECDDGLSLFSRLWRAENASLT